MKQSEISWPDAPTPSRADLRVATLDLPYGPSAELPAGTEVSGRLVTVRAIGSNEATFSLRHPFISTDIGLPGTGIPLDGSIRIEAGRARVAVYTNRMAAAFVGLIAGGLAMGAVSFAVQEPRWETIGMASLACGMLWWCYRRAMRAVPKVVADALDALRSIESVARKPGSKTAAAVGPGLGSIRGLE